MSIQTHREKITIQDPALYAVVFFEFQSEDDIFFQIHKLAKVPPLRIIKRLILLPKTFTVYPSSETIATYLLGIARTF